MNALQNIKQYYIYILLLAIVGVQVVYYILEKPFFTFSDDVEFVDYILKKTNFPWCIIPESGRFFPLARIEYYPILLTDLLSHEKMFFMFLLNAFKFICFFFIIFKILRKYVNYFSATVLVFLFYIFCLYYGFFPMLFTTIYPEFSLTLLLAIFVYLYLEALKTDSFKLYMASSLIVCCSLYFKEPVFILFLSFSIFRIFACRNSITKHEKYFHIASFLLVMIYCFAYYLIIYLNINNPYATPHSAHNMLEVLFEILKKHIIVIPAFIIFSYRVLLYCIGRAKPTVFDAFIFSSLVYSLAFIVLNLNQRYYYIPSMFLFYISLVALNAQAINKLSNNIKEIYKLVLVCTSMALILLANTYYVSTISLVTYYKDITQELITLIDTSSRNNIKTVLYLPSRTDNEAKMSMWNYTVFKKIHSFYSEKTAPLGTISSQESLYDALNNHSVVLSPDKVDSRRDTPPNIHVLDYIIVNAIISADNEAAKQEYCKFVNTIKKKKLRHKKVEELYASAQKLGCQLD